MMFMLSFFEVFTRMFMSIKAQPRTVRNLCCKLFGYLQILKLVIASTTLLFADIPMTWQNSILKTRTTIWRPTQHLL